MGFNDDVTPCEREQWNIAYTAGITNDVKQWMMNSIRRSDSPVISAFSPLPKSLDIASFVYVSIICMLREQRWGFSDKNDMKTALKMMETVNNDGRKAYELLRQVNDLIGRGVSPSDRVAMNSMKRWFSDKENQS